MSDGARNVLTYLDLGLQCVGGPGCIEISAESREKLSTLYADLGLAIDCLEVFGGVPIPVKQAVLRGMSGVRDALALDHILHSLGDGEDAALEHALELEAD
jgi:hypothetical protein